MARVAQLGAEVCKSGNEEREEKSFVRRLLFLSCVSPLDRASLASLSFSSKAASFSHICHYLPLYESGTSSQAVW